MDRVVGTRDKVLGTRDKLMYMVKKPPVAENVSKFMGTIFPYKLSVLGYWEK